MTGSYLSERQIQIVRSLRDTATGGRRELLKLLLEGDLPPGSIEAVCQLINDEYLMNGIGPDYNPNEYGRELESLLDAVNRARLV